MSSCWFRPPCQFLCLAALAVGCGPASPEPANEPPPASPVVAQAPKVAEPKPPTDGLVADDGRTLWASPTHGDPIDLSVVPSESDLIVCLRPAVLLATEEGRRIWRALGPAGEQARGAIEEEAAKPLDQIDQLVVGVTAGESYDAVATTLRIDPEPSNELPLLQRAIEQLLETTDRDRHATIVFSPRFLLGDGGSLLRGEWEPIRELLLAQLRDEWAAASLSLHLDSQQRLYLELRVVGNAAEPETRTAMSVAKQARGWGDELASVVAGGEWSPYSREVIERSPAMLRVLGEYARRGVEGRQAIVNGYAPRGAAHQLLLSAERIVAELANPPATNLAKAEPMPTESIADRLRRPVTISFRRESLETAVAILSDTLAAPIEIRGRDLQLEGITRNQMLGLDVEDLPAGETLVRVLRAANPDPLAKGPDDPRQRLVYVVGEGGLTITTRAAAERRGDELPAAFRSKTE